MNSETETVFKSFAGLNVTYLVCVDVVKLVYGRIGDYCKKMFITNFVD